MTLNYRCKKCGYLMLFEEIDPDSTPLTCGKCGAYHVFDDRGSLLSVWDHALPVAPSRTPPYATNDVVNHPPHYTSGPIECFDAMKSAFTKEEMIAYCKVAAFKYLWREGKKDSPIQERKKAEWYLQRSIELMEDSQAQEEPK